MLQGSVLGLTLGCLLFGNLGDRLGSTTADEFQRHGSARHGRTGPSFKVATVLGELGVTRMLPRLQIRGVQNRGVARSRPASSRAGRLSRRTSAVARAKPLAPASLEISRIRINANPCRRQHIANAASFVGRSGLAQETAAVSDRYLRAIADVTSTANKERSASSLKYTRKLGDRHLRVPEPERDLNHTPTQGSLTVKAAPPSEGRATARGFECASDPLQGSY